MVGNRLPLFRIPYLALRIIIDFYSLYEIIQLSLCSKRSLRVAKKCWEKREVVKAEVSVDIVSKINLHFHGTRFNYQFVISQAKDLQDELTHNIRLGDAVVPSIHKKTETVTYWDDKIFGIGQIVDYIKDLFDVPIDTLRIIEDQNEFVRFFDCIMSRQEFVRHCSLGSKVPADACLNHLMDTCKTFGDLWIFEKLSTQFRHNWDIQVDYLFISDGFCFTFQNLMTINCRFLELYNSSLTSKDINQFLKHWQNGGNYRIKKVSIVMNSLDQETIISGIDTVSQPEGLHRYYDDATITVDGIDIRRNDGTTGSIFFRRNNTFKFGLEPRMTDNRFPLFRIPFLALCIILDFFSPYDIIQLSLCSKRILRVAKTCWKKRGVVKAKVSVEKYQLISVEINLNFHGTPFYYRFVVSQANFLQHERTHNIRIGNAVVPSIHKDIGTVTYWEDKPFGIGQIVGYIKYLFDVPIDTLRTIEDQNEFIRAFDCIMSRQESIKECTLGSEVSADECLKHLLDTCKITGKLWIHGKLSARFRHNWNINLDGLCLSNGLCFTFQNLTTINCRFLELRYSRLINEDLNRFLKHWQNGGNARMKYVYIEMRSIDQETIISGIDTLLQPQGLVRYYEDMNGSKYLKFGGIDIRRNDGTAGTIFFLRNNTFEFGLEPRMAKNRFQLFRIPFLALCLILDFFSPYDIIQLSLCSKRSLRVAKKCWKKQGVVKAEISVHIVSKIDLHFHGIPFYYQFLIYQAKDLQNQQTHKIRIGDGVVPSIHKYNETVTYWDNKIFGIGQIVGYIKDLFDVPIHSINRAAEEYPNEFIRCFDCIMSQQESIREFSLGSNVSVDEYLKHLLGTRKMIGNLWIYGKLSARFKHNWKINLDYLYISNGLSFTLQNLTTINCRFLQLRYSRLINEDLNRFLKHWQNGGNSSIKKVSIEMRSIDQETIISGIDTVSQPQELHRYYEDMNGSKNRMFGGIDIRRNDGTTGSIFFRRNNTFEFGVDLLPANF
ncbi:unnamed protein product [Caenorhabditis brenneri]